MARGAIRAGVRGACAVLLVLASALAASRPVVHWADGRLTLHATEIPLATVLEDVARAAGVDLLGAPAVRPVSVHLEGVRLEDALTQLLGRDNFAVTYTRDGRVRTVEVLGAAAERRLWPPIAEPGDAPEDPAIARDREVMGRTVAVHGLVATALGTTRPTVGQLVIAAFREPGAAVRSDVQRLAMAEITRDAQVEEAFTRSLTVIEDGTLAEILRRWGRTGSDEFLAKLAAEARSPELRAKAAAVRQRLNEPPPPGRRAR